VLLAKVQVELTSAVRELPDSLVPAGLATFTAYSYHPSCEIYIPGRVVYYPKNRISDFTRGRTKNDAWSTSETSRFSSTQDSANRRAAGIGGDWCFNRVSIQWS
jgi:hypothetical protein